MLLSSSPEKHEKIQSGEWDADVQPQAEDRQVSHMLEFHQAHHPKPHFLEIGIPGMCQLQMETSRGRSLEALGRERGEGKGWAGL